MPLKVRLVCAFAVACMILFVVIKEYKNNRNEVREEGVHRSVLQNNSEDNIKELMEHKTACKACEGVLQTAVSDNPKLPDGAKKAVVEQNTNTTEMNNLSNEKSVKRSCAVLNTSQVQNSPPLEHLNIPQEESKNEQEIKDLSLSASKGELVSNLERNNPKKLGRKRSVSLPKLNIPKTSSYVSDTKSKPELLENPLETILNEPSIETCVPIINSGSGFTEVNTEPGTTKSVNETETCLPNSSVDLSLSDSGIRPNLSDNTVEPPSTDPNTGSNSLIAKTKPGLLEPESNLSDANSVLSSQVPGTEFKSHNGEVNVETTKLNEASCTRESLKNQPFWNDLSPESKDKLQPFESWSLKRISCNPDDITTSGYLSILASIWHELADQNSSFSEHFWKIEQKEGVEYPGCVKFEHMEKFKNIYSTCLGNFEGPFDFIDNASLKITNLQEPADPRDLVSFMKHKMIVYYATDRKLSNDQSKVSGMRFWDEDVMDIPGSKFYDRIWNKPLCVENDILRLLACVFNVKLYCIVLPEKGKGKSAEKSASLHIYGNSTDFSACFVLGWRYNSAIVRPTTTVL